MQAAQVDLPELIGTGVDPAGQQWDYWHVKPGDCLAAGVWRAHHPTIPGADGFPLDLRWVCSLSSYWKFKTTVFAWVDDLTGDDPVFDDALADIDVPPFPGEGDPAGISKTINR